MILVTFTSPIFVFHVLCMISGHMCKSKMVDELCLVRLFREIVIFSQGKETHYDVPYNLSLCHRLII